MTFVYVVRNLTGDSDGLAVFQTKAKAIDWLKKKGLTKKEGRGGMYMYPDQTIDDIDEYMYWIQKMEVRK